MKILIIAKYDSFAMRLYQYVGKLLKQKRSTFIIEVKRNDEVTLSQMRKDKYHRIIITPGSGYLDNPDYFEACSSFFTKISRKTLVLGGIVGLLHYFGGRVISSKLLKHGTVCTILHDNKGIFKGLPQGIQIMRNQTVIVDSSSLPPDLVITASVASQEKHVSTDIRDIPFSDKKFESVNETMLRRVVENHSEIMGLRHRIFPIEGIQFHPAFFATEGGKKMLTNFLY